MGWKLGGSTELVKPNQGNLESRLSAAESQNRCAASSVVADKNISKLWEFVSLVLQIDNYTVLDSKELSHWSQITDN